jgi:hypothetical protein
VSTAEAASYLIGGFDRACAASKFNVCDAQTVAKFCQKPVHPTKLSGLIKSVVGPLLPAKANAL